MTQNEVSTINEIMNLWIQKHPNASIEQYNKKLQKVTKEIVKAY